MSQNVETPARTFQAASALAIHLRVKLNGSNKLAVCGAGATENELGTLTRATTAADERVAVRLPNAQGTTKMVAANAVAQEALVYAAAGGKVDDVVNGKPIGVALEAATATNDIIEVLRVGAMVIVSHTDAVDDAALSFGTGTDAQLLFSTGDASNHAFVLAVDDTSQQMHITDKGAKATDWARAAGTHPELAIHSNTTPATDYLAIGNHDGTTAVIDVVGGTTLTLDIAGTPALSVLAASVTVAGRLISTGDVGNAAGIGITGTAAVFSTTVERHGLLFKTTIIVDLTGLNSGGTAEDVIGADGAGKAHLGRITAAVNGTVFAGRLSCLETPTTGDNDINVYSATEDTGVEDTAIGDLTETALCNSGDLTAGMTPVVLANPAADQYIYLTGGIGDCNATYDAGIVMLEFWGKA